MRDLPMELWPDEDVVQAFHEAGIFTEEELARAENQRALLDFDTEMRRRGLAGSALAEEMRAQVAVMARAFELRVREVGHR
jgi:hypothetical protein